MADFQAKHHFSEHVSNKKLFSLPQEKTDQKKKEKKEKGTETLKHGRNIRIIEL